MDEAEAFEILNLPASSSNEEIEERFREMVPENHPDQRGENDDLKRLTEARDVALSQDSTDLELVESTLDTIAEKQIARDERRIEAEKTVERLKRRSTSKYRRRRHLSILSGVITAGVVGMYRFIQNAEFFTLNPVILIFVLSYIGGFGVVSAFFHLSMKNIESLINDADDALEDKMRFIQLLEDIGMDFQSDPSFTRSELEDKIEEWRKDPDNPTNPLSLIIFPQALDFKRLAQLVGTTDFTRLLIRKGLAKQIFKEDESLEEGNWTVRYRLNLPTG